MQQALMNSASIMEASTTQHDGVMGQAARIIDRWMDEGREIYDLKPGKLQRAVRSRVGRELTESESDAVDAVFYSYAT